MLVLVCKVVKKGDSLSEKKIKEKLIEIITGC